FAVVGRERVDVGEVHRWRLRRGVLRRHRLRLEILGAGEEARVRIRDALLLRPILGDEPGVRGEHHREEERDDDERDHADRVLAKPAPGERPQARRFLDRELDPRLRGDDRGNGIAKLFACGHLKLTLGSTNLYMTSTSRFTITVNIARYTVTALITGKSLRLTAVMISRPRPGMEKTTSRRNEPTKTPGR